MLRDITIGQYYPVSSKVHALDPRTKILIVFAYIFSLFLITSFWGYLFVILCLVSVVKISKVPFSFMLKGLKGIVFILSFTVVLNVFLTRGETVFWTFGIFSITLEGILFALKMGGRLILLVVGTSMLTLTTSPIQLTDGIEYLLKPFAKMGLPAHEIAMMMSIALRFIPILLEETDKIMKAQMARGADFESGKMLERAKAMVPILIPLFISAFRRAEELAMAMEARCYRGGSGRTRMNQLKYQKPDYISFVYTSVFIVGAILL